MKKKFVFGTFAPENTCWFLTTAYFKIKLNNYVNLLKTIKGSKKPKIKIIKHWQLLKSQANKRRKRGTEGEHKKGKASKQAGNQIPLVNGTSLISSLATFWSISTSTGTHQSTLQQQQHQWGCGTGQKKFQKLFLTNWLCSSNSSSKQCLTVKLSVSGAGDWLISQHQIGKQGERNKIKNKFGYFKAVLVKIILRKVTISRLTFW